MNLVNFWKSQTEIWNEEEKCGFCWAFGGVTTVPGIEQYKIREGEECCVHVFITDDGFNEVINYGVRPFIRNTNCQDIFTLWVLYPSSLGLNNYKEIPGHPVEQSTEETILTPLKSCLTCEVVLDMCEAAGYLFEIIKWQGYKVRNFTNHNFTGWKIMATFQELN
jgi:hypothetical protein